MEKKGLKYIVGVLLIVVGLVSCEKEPVAPDNPTGKTKEEKAAGWVYDVMNYWYLWYDKMPSVGRDEYGTPQLMLEALRYKEIDRWSMLLTMQEYQEIYMQGTYEGHGFSMGTAVDENLYIVFVYKDSDMWPQGVRRGWKIVKINGVAVNASSNVDLSAKTNEFLFEKPNGSTQLVSSTKKEVKTNTVLYADTLMLDNTVVGHMVFNSFIEPSLAELDTAFSNFKALGATKFILDMRYNRGGQVNVAEKLASILAGTENVGKVFFTDTHNDMRSDNNSSHNFQEEDYTLEISDLIIFSTSSTASASELIINGLKPYFGDTQRGIGSRSYGKPTGMYGFEYESSWVFFPVTMKSANSEGYGDYFDGLPVDSEKEDDIRYGFSNREEPFLKEAIHYFNNGTFTGSSASKKSMGPVLNKEDKGLLWRTDVY